MTSESNNHPKAGIEMCKMAFVHHSRSKRNRSGKSIGPRRVSFDTTESSKESGLPLPQEQLNQGSITSTDCCSMENYTGFRIDYDIGDEVHSPSDMIIKYTTQEAMEDADSLQRHEFAFIKRSDGSCTYAILSSRSSDSLTFVMDTNGSTKEESRKRWSEMVRLVNDTRIPVISEERGTKCPIVYNSFLLLLLSSCENKSNDIHVDSIHNCSKLLS